MKKYSILFLILLCFLCGCTTITQTKTKVVDAKIININKSGSIAYITVEYDGLVDDIVDVSISNSKKIGDIVKVLQVTTYDEYNTILSMRLTTIK